MNTLNLCHLFVHPIFGGTLSGALLGNKEKALGELTGTTECDQGSDVGRGKRGYRLYRSVCGGQGAANPVWGAGVGD